MQSTVTITKPKVHVLQKKVCFLQLLMFSSQSCIFVYILKIHSTLIVSYPKTGIIISYHIISARPKYFCTNSSSVRSCSIIGTNFRTLDTIDTRAIDLHVSINCKFTVIERASQGLELAGSALNQ